MVLGFLPQNHYSIAAPPRLESEAFCVGRTGAGIPVRAGKPRRIKN
jgi:hypothetical protein